MANYLPFQLYIENSETGVVQTKELQDYAKQNGISQPRNTINILNSMEEAGIIEKARIKGMRKREGWKLVEQPDTPSYEMWTTIIRKKGNKEKIKLQALTQPEIYNLIQKDLVAYRKIVYNKKSKLYKNPFYFPMFHMLMVESCMKWIARLSLAINSGLFMENKTKEKLARKNIDLVEQFMRELLRTVAKHYLDTPKKYDVFLITMNNYFESINMFGLDSNTIIQTS